MRTGFGQNMTRKMSSGMYPIGKCGQQENARTQPHSITAAAFAAARAVTTIARPFFMESARSTSFTTAQHATAMMIIRPQPEAPAAMAWA